MTWVDIERADGVAPFGTTPRRALAEVLIAILADPRERPAAVLIDVGMGGEGGMAADDAEAMITIQTVLGGLSPGPNGLPVVYVFSTACPSRGAPRTYFDPRKLGALSWPTSAGERSVAPVTWMCPNFGSSTQSVWSCVVGVSPKGAHVIALPGPLWLGAARGEGRAVSDLYGALQQADRACASNSREPIRLIDRNVDQVAPLPWIPSERGADLRRAGVTKIVWPFPQAEAPIIEDLGDRIVVISSSLGLAQDVLKVRGREISGALVVVTAFRQGYVGGLPARSPLAISLIAAVLAYAASFGLYRFLLSKVAHLPFTSERGDFLISWVLMTGLGAIALFILPWRGGVLFREIGLGLAMATMVVGAWGLCREGINALRWAGDRLREPFRRVWSGRRFGR